MEYLDALETSSLPLRLKKELRSKAVSLDFSEKDFMAISVRSGNEGIFIFSPEIQKKAFYFRLAKLVSSKHGNLKPVICDFCFCWLPGSKVSMISFSNSKNKNKSHTFYCCSKLNCNENVRGTTLESDESRLLLREDISIPGRINRLRQSLTKVAHTIDM